MATVKDLVHQRAGSLAVTLALLALPRVALAEVCDKEVPSWNPYSGPISQPEFLLNSFMSPLGVVVVGSVCLGLAYRRLWIALLAALVSALYASSILLFWQVDDQIYAQSIAEGCRVTPIYLVIILFFVCVGFVITSVRRGISAVSDKRLRRNAL